MKVRFFLSRQFFRSLAGRMLSVAAVMLILSAVVGGLVLSYAFRSYALADIDDQLARSLDVMVGVSEIGPDGVLRFTRPLFDPRFGQPYSGWYWQVSEAGKEAFRSRSLWDFELETDTDERRFDLMIHEHIGPDGQILRVAERDIILPEADRVMRYMVATDTGSVRAAIKRFNELLFILLALITLTITLTLIGLLAFGLRPFRRMISRLADVRAGKRQSMGVEYPTDLAPLASEIDNLIQHNDKLLTRARTHVGNLAHGVKTPLAVIRNEVLELKGPVSGRISKQLDDIVSQLDHHLRRARVSGSRHGPGVAVEERLHKTMSAIGRLYSDKNLEMPLLVDRDLAFRGETQDFDEITGNLIENAGKWAKNKLAVTAFFGDGETAIPSEDTEKPLMMTLIVEDDGVGVPEEEWPTLFERGRRLDETVPGTGLGLAIVRDVVELYGGTAELGKSRLGGLRVQISLPAKRLV